MSGVMLRWLTELMEVLRYLLPDLIVHRVLNLSPCPQQRFAHPV